ncbi:MAG: hypothetical protein H6617_09215 [Bdellovibrionaceae bacterium]|nr:hypothetical protein [Bdellovibrionales bacterium]MCB9254847.1 hypothetical protein [Pseudobdellovibrionaceae bacterium]
MTKLWYALVAFLSLLCASRLSAYPQMTAHGYSSCLACHVAPSGGGLLSAYGRSLSREVLSTWGAENEEGVLHGVVPASEVLLLGGDVRALQLFMRSPYVDLGRFIWMQADLEAGVRLGEFTVVGSIGYQNPTSANYSGSSFFSRKHYVLWNFSETNFLRAGKFDGAYGIRWPDHFMFARRDLSWDEGSESYRLEWAKLEETWQLIASVSIGRPDAPQLQIEKAATVRLAKYFGENHQIILSAHYGLRSTTNRFVFGPSAVFTLLEGLSVFAQVDFQQAAKFGFLEYLRINYEVLKGIHLYGMQELSVLDASSASTTKQAYTLGVQWFPRPHFEFLVGLRKSTSGSVATGATDSLMLLMHYYL